VPILNHQLSSQFIKSAFTDKKNSQNIPPNVDQLETILTTSTEPKCQIDARRVKVSVEALPDDIPQADAMIATLSIAYPIQDLSVSGSDPDHRQRLQILVNCLSKLKFKGVLYVDVKTLSMVLAKDSDWNPNLTEKQVETLTSADNLQILQKEIEEIHGIIVEFTKLPATMYFTTDREPGGMFVKQPEGIGVQTYPLVAITSLGNNEDDLDALDFLNL
jgi:hypothetical protein